MLKDLLSSPEAVHGLIELVVSILGALGAALTPLLLRWFRAHGIQIDAQEQQQIETIARSAVGYAEEWAHARARGGSAPSGDEKMAAALEAARKLAAGRLRKVAEDRWGVAIHAQLGHTRGKPSSAAAMYHSSQPGEM